MLGNERSILPPGMKRRNPGTKKIALETPINTASLVSTQATTHSEKFAYYMPFMVVICDDCQLSYTCMINVIMQS